VLLYDFAADVVFDDFGYSRFTTPNSVRQGVNRFRDTRFDDQLYSGMLSKGEIFLD